MSTQVADAIRKVTAEVQKQIGTQKRRPIDDHDLIEMLLAIADELDPEMPAAVGDGCEFCRADCNRPYGAYKCPYCAKEWPDWIDCPKCGENDWDTSERDQPGEPITCCKCGNVEFA